MIVVRPYEDTDASAVRRILSQFHSRNVSPEEFKATRQQEQQYAYFHRLVLAADGQVVAYSDLFRVEGDTRDGYLLYRLRVDTPLRGRGFGRILDAATWQVIHEQSPTALEATIRDNDPASRRWAERRGYKESQHRLASVIDLDNWNMEEGHQAVERVQSNGIELLSMDAIPDVDKWQRLYDLYCTLDLDTPDREGVTEGAPYTQFEAQYVTNPLLPPEYILVARHAGQWIGMTALAIRSQTEAYTEFTGTLRAYRGQKVAFALKAASLVKAQAGGIRTARTNNLSSNGPMIAVNQRLGYQSAPGLWIMDLHLSE